MIFLKQSRAVNQHGVTLTETLVVVAILAILASIAVPSYQDNLERKRLKQVVEALKSDMQFARAEAIKRSQNVHVSRSTGTAGNWCYGLKEAANCDCNETNSEDIDYCGIKIVSGSNFHSSINMDSASTANSTFDFRRGTIGSSGQSFSTKNYAARVVFSNSGRIRICSQPNSEGKKLIEYPACD